MGTWWNKQWRIVNGNSCRKCAEFSPEEMRPYKREFQYQGCKLWSLLNSMGYQTINIHIYIYIYILSCCLVLWCIHWYHTLLLTCTMMYSLISYSLVALYYDVFTDIILSCWLVLWCIHWYHTLLLPCTMMYSLFYPSDQDLWMKTDGDISPLSSMYHPLHCRGLFTPIYYKMSAVHS